MHTHVSKTLNRNVTGVWAALSCFVSLLCFSLSRWTDLNITKKRKKETRGKCQIRHIWSILEEKGREKEGILPPDGNINSGNCSWTLDNSQKRRKRHGPWCQMGLINTRTRLEYSLWISSYFEVRKLLQCKSTPLAWLSNLRKECAKKLFTFARFRARRICVDVIFLHAVVF